MIINTLTKETGLLQMKRIEGNPAMKEGFSKILRGVHTKKGK